MKVHVLYDESGHVGAILHGGTQASGAGPVKGQTLRQGFAPREGQHAAVLDVPAELEHVKPRQLHDAVRVVVKQGRPQLVKR